MMRILAIRRPAWFAVYAGEDTPYACEWRVNIAFSIGMRSSSLR
jgi:hypothetical protein